MELILLQKVTNLGNLGDKVNVKPGYGRNFLVPQGKAVPATAANVAEFETKRAEYEAKAKAIHDEAESRAAKFEGASVTLQAHAATEGKLYGSVGPREIAEAFTAAGHQLRLPLRLEPFAQRHRVERPVAVGHLADRTVDQLVVAPVEIALDQLVADPVVGFRRQHQAAEHGLLGLDRMRRDAQLVDAGIACAGTETGTCGHDRKTPADAGSRPAAMLVAPAGAGTGQACGQAVCNRGTDAGPANGNGRLAAPVSLPCAWLDQA